MQVKIRKTSSQTVTYEFFTGTIFVVTRNGAGGSVPLHLLPAGKDATVKLTNGKTTVIKARDVDLAKEKARKAF